MVRSISRVYGGIKVGQRGGDGRTVLLGHFEKIERGIMWMGKWIYTKYVLNSNQFFGIDDDQALWIFPMDLYISHTPQHRLETGSSYEI